MNWSSHASTKMSFYLFWINSHKKSLPSTVSKMLIDSLVLSWLMYALPAWGPMMTKSQTNRLQHLHNWGTRITANLRRSNHVTHHQKKLNWLSISSFVKYRSLCVMNNIYMNKDNNLFNPSISFGQNHCYKTRHSSRFIPPVFCNLACTKTQFVVATQVSQPYIAQLPIRSCGSIFGKFLPIGWDTSLPTACFDSKNYYKFN